MAQQIPQTFIVLKKNCLTFYSELVIAENSWFVFTILAIQVIVNDCMNSSIMK